MVTGFTSVAEKKKQDLLAADARSEDAIRRMYRIEDVAEHLFYAELLRKYKAENGIDILGDWHKEKGKYRTFYEFLVAKEYDIALEKLTQRYATWGAIRPVSPSPEILGGLV